jgi:hypothetical protein
MSIEQFLESLTPEQLEHLAEIKRQEGKESPKKRKQNRKKLILPDDEPKPSQSTQKNPRQRAKNKPVRVTDTQIKQTGSHPNIPKAHNYGKNLGPPELGKRPNRFATGDYASVQNTDKHLIEEDKKHWEGKVPTPRMMSREEYFSATCSRCQNLFENVPGSECYKDDTGYAFICEDCLNNMGR